MRFNEIINNNLIVTSAMGSGTTSFLLYIAKRLIDDGKLVLFYNPTADIDIKYISKYYKPILGNCIFANMSTSDIFTLIPYMENTIDYFIMDPGDSLMINKPALKMLVERLKSKNIKVIFSSQIRNSPDSKKPYSTVEKLNEKYKLFDYSIWLRKVSENDIFNRKYVEIYSWFRNKTNYKGRTLCSFSKEGNVLSVKDNLIK